jgi:hypothetical protein
MVKMARHIVSFFSLQLDSGHYESGSGVYLPFLHCKATEGIRHLYFSNVKGAGNKETIM